MELDLPTAVAGMLLDIFGAHPRAAGQRLEHDSRCNSSHVAHPVGARRIQRSLTRVSPKFHSSTETLIPQVSSCPPVPVPPSMSLSIGPCYSSLGVRRLPFGADRDGTGTRTNRRVRMSAVREPAALWHHRLQ